MKKGFSFDKNLIIGIISGVIIFVLSLFSYFNSMVTTAYVGFVCAIVLITFFVVTYLTKRKRFVDLFNSMVEQVTLPNSEVFTKTTLPVIILQDNNTVIWYNNNFKTTVLRGSDIKSDDTDAFLSQSLLNSFDFSGKGEIKIGQKSFTVFNSSFSNKGNNYQVLFYVDDTPLRKAAEELIMTRPVVAVLNVDMYEEMSENLPDSRRAALQSSIEKELEEWVAKTNGFLKKIRNGSYLLVTDEKSYSILKNDRFSVLEKVRSIETNSDTSLSLSIGIGRGYKTHSETEETARKALEMAQSRGGDQVVVKTANNYEFFGGNTNSTNTGSDRVKARLIAAALKELVRGSDYVFITGHRFGDLDSLGSAFGLYRTVKDYGIPAKIVVDRQKSLAKSLIDRITVEDPDAFMDEDKALEKVTKRSLLIITDTHRTNLVDASKLYAACPTVIIIDHHRKAADHIENAVVFYHDPKASSACEMVSELIQYMSDKKIEKFQAEALLAGITLDTRNFVLRTGVGTFEASAFLRKNGADPVEVRKLFSDSMEVYKEKSTLISNAEIYNHCAISVASQTGQNTRIAVAQAADELLGITGVYASFVAYKTADTVNISARSLGAINVQIIMEQLGGGGHHTMAAAQIKTDDTKIAVNALIKVINEYVQ